MLSMAVTGVTLSSAAVGDDILSGGAQRDILFGGGGADTFVFAEGDGRDTILDFRDGADQIDVSSFGITDFAGLEDDISGRFLRSVVDFGDGDRLVLLGVDRRDLGADDFIFALPDGSDLLT